MNILSYLSKLVAGTYKYVLLVSVIPKCEFYDKQLCGFTTSTTDGAAMAWTFHKGSTPSGGTGPNADHTNGTNSGRYSTKLNVQ